MGTLCESCALVPQGLRQPHVTAQSAPTAACWRAWACCCGGAPGRHPGCRAPTWCIQYVQEHVGTPETLQTGVHSRHCSLTNQHIIADGSAAQVIKLDRVLVLSRSRRGARKWTRNKRDNTHHNENTTVRRVPVAKEHLVWLQLNLHTLMHAVGTAAWNAHASLVESETDICDAVGRHALVPVEQSQA